MEHSKRNFCNNVLLQQSKQCWLMTISSIFSESFYLVTYLVKIGNKLEAIATYTYLMYKLYNNE